MYLKSIRITNFRCFGNDGIEAVFNKGVNAIIGENNSGKSALIDGIRIAFSTVYYQKDIYFTKSDFHVDLSGKITQTAQFDIALSDVPKNLIEIWDPENDTCGEFHVKFYTAKSPTGIDKVKYSAWGGKTEGNTLSAETFDAIDVAFLGALRDSETEMKPSKSSKLAELLGTIANTDESRKDLVTVLNDANEKLLEKQQLSQIREVINHNLLNIEQELLSQQIDIGLIEPKFDSIASSMRAWVRSKWIYIEKACPVFEQVKHQAKNKKCDKLINTTNEGLYLNIFPFIDIVKDDANVTDDLKNSLAVLAQRTFELKQNGLGYNNLIFMSTILGDMSIEKRGVYQSLFLIEEPEAHLHPQLQELVHCFFENQHRNAETIQVIYTSHSPTLVSKIGVDKINLVFERDHKIKCLPLTRTSLDDTDKIYLEKYLDVTKSQLFFAKGIIFVEGISEALLLPQMAAILNLPLDKYAIEIVNVDSIAFKPFANLLSEADGEKCFAKASIITDDDRCTTKSSVDTYISKDIDFDDNVKEIVEKLQKGCASGRFTKIQDLCENKDIYFSGAYKTFEYELAFCEENIILFTQIIKGLYPEVGARLEAKVNQLDKLVEKQVCIWLFIRYRDESKGELAQALSKTIKEQQEQIMKGEIVENLFKVPEYIKKAIEYVTEKISEDTQ